MYPFVIMLYIITIVIIVIRGSGTPAAENVGGTEIRSS